jgi:hypothetical protein
MPIVYMQRDDDVAEVNSDHLETYENFLAHGWKIKPAAEAPGEPVEAPKPDDAAPDAHEAPESAPEAPVKPAKASRKPR